MSHQLAPESPPAIKSASFPKGVLSPSSHAPINEIPLELLLNIIDEDLKPIVKGKYYARIYDLMLVCSGWANIIKETPKFWSLVDSRCPNLLPLILQRSDPAPLTIERHIVGMRPSLDDAVFRESHRWESVQIVQPPLDCAGDLQRRLESSSAPRLKSFSVTGFNGLANSKPVKNLFSGHAPQLQSLSLTRFPILINSPIFKNINLCTLKLVTMDLGYLTWPAFFDMLKRFEALTVLEFNTVTFPEIPEGEAPPVISLPNLTRICIEKLTSAEAIWLLRALHIPRCETGKVDIIDFEGEEPEDLPSRTTAPHLVNTFQSILNTATRLAMAVSEENFRITASSNGRNIFDFSGRLGEQAQQVLETATKEWGLMNLQIPTQIRLHFEEVEVEPMLYTLRTLQHVETIVMFQVEEDVVQAVLRLLSEPIEGPNAVTRWYCPRLESMLCYQCNTSGSTPSDYMSMLRCRYEDFGGLPGVERPKRLRYLYIATCESCNFYSRKVLREIWEMLEPEGKLRWNPSVGLPDFTLPAEAGESIGDDVPDLTTFDEEYEWLDFGEDDGDEDEDEEDGEGEEKGEEAGGEV